MVDCFGDGFTLHAVPLPFGSPAKAQAGLPVDTRATVGACVFCIGFFALALFQVLSHR